LGYNLCCQRYEKVSSASGKICKPWFWDRGDREETYAETSNSMQFASPYPKLKHFASALQSPLQAANVFLVPEDSK
jgi:hypothetical protein